MMKKIFVFALTFMIMLCFFACDDGKQPVIPTPTPAPTETPKLVDNITFRRGETIEGELLFTGDALQEVFVTTDPVTARYALNLHFTEAGAALLEQYSRELKSSKEKLSLWIGEERIICAGFEDVISDGKMQVVGNFTSEKVNELYNKFYGITQS